MDKLNLSFSRILKKRRENLKLTQEELAARCDVSRNFISLLETGESLPSLPVLFTIANELETTPENLIKQARLGLVKK